MAVVACDTFEFAGCQSDVVFIFPYVEQPQCRI